MPYKRNLGWETPSIWTYNLGKYETFLAQQNELYICLIWKKGNLWMQKSETLICSIWAKALDMNNTQRLGLAASLAFQVWLLQLSTHSKVKQFAIQSCCQFKPFLVRHASSSPYLCKCWAHSFCTLSCSQLLRSFMYCVNLDSFGTPFSAEFLWSHRFIH